MKVVINACFGGYSLSPAAIRRLAELKGRPCYFFKQDIKDGLSGPFYALSDAEAATTFCPFAFDVPNPDEVIPSQKHWHEMTDEQRSASRDAYNQHQLDSRPEPRHDPDLVRVVEEMGPAANGPHAELRVVEIPDGTEYTIEEYDGSEHIAEVHRTWR